MAKAKNFLFVCNGNECRSQMAEGFARQMAGGTVNIYSAGEKPKGISKYAVDVMEEVGIDISSQDVRAFDAVPMNKIDTVITLSSDADVLPKTLKKKVTQIHWPLNDPAATSGSDAEVKKAFRSVRDEIRNRVEVLLVG
ncbi:MAG: arsenate reductase (thioredoxin) [Planctomycetota bacterium]|nr:MAG: arsenate reductase (thioredoxin) [Planctomycetota bacterium]